MNIEIRNIVKTDYPKIQEIFTEGIATKNATFETAAPDWEKWNGSKLPYCRLAAVSEDEIIGYASLTATSYRKVYRGVNELSIYISKLHMGKGIGKKLLQALIDESEKNGVWTLTASIFPENEVSIKLHKALGFREVGYREKVACMDGVWRDTIEFERRSKLVGI